MYSSNFRSHDGAWLLWVSVTLLQRRDYPTYVALVSAFEGFRRIVRDEVVLAGRDNLRFFELDYQPTQTLPLQGGSAA